MSTYCLLNEYIVLCVLLLPRIANYFQEVLAYSAMLILNGLKKLVFSQDHLNFNNNPNYNDHKRKHDSDDNIHEEEHVAKWGKLTRHG